MSPQSEPQQSEPQRDTSERSAGQRFYGKYRGVVTNNIDPLGDSRLMVLVPAIPFAVAMWAVPCVPYAGTLEGLHLIPMIGANVWVEFEGGDPSYPIWVGFYWETLEMFKRKMVNPLIPALAKILKTLCSEFTLDDTPALGGVKLQSLPPAVSIPTTLQFDAMGISLSCPPCSITMNPLLGITISVGPLTSISLGLDGITVTAPKVEVSSLTTLDLKGLAMVGIKGAIVNIN